MRLSEQIMAHKVLHRLSSQSASGIYFRHFVLWNQLQTSPSVNGGFSRLLELLVERVWFLSRAVPETFVWGQRFEDEEEERREREREGRDRVDALISIMQSLQTLSLFTLRSTETQRENVTWIVGKLNMWPYHPGLKVELKQKCTKL